MEYSLPFYFSFSAQAELLLWPLSDLSNNGCGFPEVPSEESSPPRNCSALHTPLPCLRCLPNPSREGERSSQLPRWSVGCDHDPLTKNRSICPRRAALPGSSGTR